MSPKFNPNNYIIMNARSSKLQKDPSFVNANNKIKIGFE